MPAAELYGLLVRSAAQRFSAKRPPMKTLLAIFLSALVAWLLLNERARKLIIVYFLVISAITLTPFGLHYVEEVGFLRAGQLSEFTCAAQTGCQPPQYALGEHPASGLPARGNRHTALSLCCGICIHSRDRIRYVAQQLAPRGVCAVRRECAENWLVDIAKNSTISSWEVEVGFERLRRSCASELQFQTKFHQAYCTL